MTSNNNKNVEINFVGDTQSAGILGRQVADYLKAQGHQVELDSEFRSPQQAGSKNDKFSVMISNSESKSPQSEARA